MELISSFILLVHSRLCDSLCSSPSITIPYLSSPLPLSLHSTAALILCKNWCEPCCLWTGKSIWFLCGNLHF